MTRGNTESHQSQPHIAAPAKHLQAIMMLWLKPEASFRSEGNGNGEGNQPKPTIKIAAQIVGVRNINDHLKKGRY